MTTFAGATTGTALRNLVGVRSDPMRLLRGAELAERGVVSSLDIRAGELRGLVSGSRRESYSVKITTPVTGTAPGAGSPIRWSCTCPDWGDPCKHAVAVMLVAAQRLEEDSDLAATFVGSDAQAPTEAVQTEAGARPTVGPTPTARSSRPTGLPVVAPLWAEGLSDTTGASSAQQFFGDAPLGTTPTTPPSDPSIGPDRLRQLGPLIVDSYDLAPDIIRMYSGLRDD